MPSVQVLLFILFFLIYFITEDIDIQFGSY